MGGSRKQTGFDGYLQERKSATAGEHTHTRIGNKDLGVYGGSFAVKDTDMKEFWNLYYNHVFVSGKQEFLTEKQLHDNGPILVDIDMRFDTSVEERRYTKDHVSDMVMLYVEKLTEILEVPKKGSYPIFVMEKPEVNMQDDVTKDGIHMIIGIAADRPLQMLLRKKVLEELPTLWSDLQIKNSWNEVLDEGISKGCVNWQLYGSRKPGHKAYLVKYLYDMCFNNDESSWTIQEKLNTGLDMKKLLPMLSARNTDFTRCDVTSDYEAEYEVEKNKLKSGNKTGSNTGKVTMKPYIDLQAINCDLINSMEQLDASLEAMFENVRTVDYELKEAHQYTMTLPDCYYGPGSYNKWIRVGWALKNTHPQKMLLTFLKFSSQSPTFTFADIPELCERWRGFNYNSEGHKFASIMYWSKMDAYDKYLVVKRETISFFIEETLHGATEFDIANVLYHMFKDRFVCASIKHNIWYEWRNSRWFEIDSGNSLRLLISKQVHDKYTEITRQTIDAMHHETSGEEKWLALQKRSNKLADVSMLLKRTQSKNNIMREARELFYDKDFIEKLDTNPYLLCFNNCVVDFELGTHRKARPDDYISKCTNIDYITSEELNDPKYADTIREVKEFQKQLFPEPELERYMWEHDASALIGKNLPQTFNIFLGTGANGKSKKIDLMSKCFGSYKGTVPITLVTQKRNSIGGTSSEVVQLQGTRYAVMQEPSKGDKINEGIMKEITGGDPIQARALFKDTVTFVPQFKLVVCTNTLFDIASNDDGTWRRIRLCDFKSKFIDEPYGDEKRFPKKDYPYQYPVDKDIDRKFDAWAPVYMSMLVELAYKTKGVVKDCPMVLASSDKYREGQDYLAEFAKDKIEECEGKRVKKTELMETFKQWYQVNYGRAVPKGREICDFMDKRYGAYSGKKGWMNIKIIYDEEDEDGEDEYE
jgi:P4 family phage/plasmid primase-like protien